MLMRISGGSAGIKEYLERGQKAGRDFDRDQLDERVVLAGDLEETDRIIQAMDTEGQRYLHITLSMKEDEIPNETMKAIVEEVRSLLFSAYEPDEYSFYAEAHQPKIKSYRDHNGLLVTRKGHIHIAVPMENLLTGRRLEPLGKVEFQEKHLEAIQEHINNKFGLASPKDNPRIAHIPFTDASDMLERYGAPIFKSQAKEIRKAIFEAIMDRKIERWSDFNSMLKAEGLEVITRNEGREGREYLNIRPEGPGKGINLNDGVFSRRFIEFPTEEKRRLLSTDIQEKYLQATAARRDPAYIADTLTEWQEVRARELKHVKSGNKPFYKKYQAADREGKLAILADQEARYAAKYRKEPHYVARENSSGPHELTREPPPAQRDRLRSLSELDVVRIAGRGQVLLPDHAPGELKHSGTERDHALRRDGDRPGGSQPGVGNAGGGRGTGRDVDSVTGQLLRDLKENREQRKTVANPEFAEIKQNLDAARLLTRLAVSHGLQAEKYGVVKGKDGADRIQCGTNARNVSDFLTKEMHLPWAEAAPILREAYQAQLAHEPQTVTTPAPKSELWREFQNWRRSDWKAEKDEAWRSLKADVKTKLAEFKETYQVEKAKIYAGRDHTTAAERRASISLVRMNRVQAEKTLSERFKTDSAALREKFGRKVGDLYPEFLTRRADRGDPAALAELRRQQPKPESNEVAPTTPTIEAAKNQATVAPHHAPSPYIETLRYNVGKHGDVTYFDKSGDAILRDEAKRVAVFKGEDRDAIETALRLSIQKFGSKLAINGDDDFKRRAVEVAVERGLRIEFADEKWDSYRKHLEEQGAGKTKFEGLAKTKSTEDKTTDEIVKAPDQAPETGTDSPQAGTPATERDSLKTMIEDSKSGTEYEGDEQNEQPKPPEPRRPEDDYGLT